MYIVFYNCYNSSELISFIPKWIKTDLLNNNSTPTKKNNYNSKKVDSTNYMTKSFNSSHSLNCV